tara:strand:+ start:304 stop:870 length:567 start_codon:yes stop_codon:yes gene_type:complete
MAYQKDYMFTFEDGATLTLQAKGKAQARMWLCVMCKDRVGQTAQGTDEDGKVFKAKVKKLDRTSEYTENLKAYRTDPITPDNIEWGITSNSDAPVDENSVGYKTEYTSGIGIAIPHLKDGIYKVRQYNYDTKKEILLKSRILIWLGQVDILSCKVAVAEFHNRTGDWHYFIEQIHRGRSNSLSFSLGS